MRQTLIVNVGIWCYFLFAGACVAEAAPLKKASVTGSKAQAMIQALLDFSRPVQESNKDYVWNLSKIECNFSNNGSLELTESTFNLPDHFECASLNLKNNNSAGRSFFQALSAIGAEADYSLGHGGISVEHLMCRIHISESESKKRFSCQSTFAEL